MTFDHLRQLLAILSDAIDAIENIYSQSLTAPYASPPPSPSCPQPPQQSQQYPLDFPALDIPYDKASPAESLAADPLVVAAISRIVAACGQMAATVQNPFLSLCDASMGYHLPSCLRLLEASHTVEIIRDAGPAGMHVDAIAKSIGMDPSKLGHILRLLATHHITREVAPNVFANNRISSMLDTGKDPHDLITSPQGKYDDTNGIAAFVGLCTDELFKSSAHLTEAFLLTPKTRLSREPTHTPFNFAFATQKGFFGWLEEGAPELTRSAALGHAKLCSPPHQSGNTFRLERFGKAMTGSSSWEAPGAILNAFDWDGLAPGSVVVDVGGGIGSTAMFLAASCDNLQFVIQDRAVVVAMGERAWRARCPEMLDSSRARFQVHDFFTSQPVLDAAVFLLRVVLHDWPDAFARQILLRLREAAQEHTRLVIADFVLPHACVDDFGSTEASEPGVNTISGVEGAERTLACPPLLANLGKGSAQAYWMDLTMQVTFNAQERTLREVVALAASAGWKVTRVTRAPGSLFGHIIAVPVTVPSIGTVVGRETKGEIEADKDQTDAGVIGVSEKEPELGVASSRCGTPTFGSRVDLPSFEEAFARFEGRSGRGKLRTPISIRGQRGGSVMGTARNAGANAGRGAPVVVSKPGKKKLPSPLTLRAHTVTQSGSEESSLLLSSPLPSPSSPVPSTPPAHRQTQAHLRTPKQLQSPPTRVLGSPPAIVSPRRATRLLTSPRRLWDAGGGVGDGIGMASLGSKSMQSGSRDDVAGGEGNTGAVESGRTVLAAAAKIERGLKKFAPS